MNRYLVILYYAGIPTNGVPNIESHWVTADSIADAVMVVNPGQNTLKMEVIPLF